MCCRCWQTQRVERLTYRVILSMELWSEIGVRRLYSMLAYTPLNRTHTSNYHILLWSTITICILSKRILNGRDTEYTLTNKIIFKTIANYTNQSCYDALGPFLKVAWKSFQELYNCLFSNNPTVTLTVLIFTWQ